MLLLPSKLLPSLIQKGHKHTSKEYDIRTENPLVNMNKKTFFFFEILYPCFSHVPLATSDTNCSQLYNVARDGTAGNKPNEICKIN